MAASFPIDPTAPRVFVDTSVIIAGVGSRVGASHAIMALAELGLLRPVLRICTPGDLLQKIRGILARGFGEG